MKKSLLLIPMLFCLSNVLFAQGEIRSNLSGFGISVDLNGTSWGLDDSPDDPESGSGFGVGILFGFNQNSVLNVRFDSAKMESEESEYGVGHFDIGLNYFFGTAENKLRPYAGLFYSGFAAVENSNPKVEMTGAGFGGTGGLHYYFTPKMALNLGLLYNAIKLQEMKIGSQTVDLDDLEATSTRVLVGLKIGF